jgi:hypothetical protein
VVVSLGTLLCVVLEVAAGPVSTADESSLPEIGAAELAGEGDANVKTFRGITAPGCPSAAYSEGVSLIS